MTHQKGQPVPVNPDLTRSPALGGNSAEGRLQKIVRPQKSEQVSFSMPKALSPLLAPFLAVWRHRVILYRTTCSEIRTLYAGSLLGSSWIVLGQLLMLCIYGVTYVYIFKVKPAELDVQEYVLYVFCGLVSFLPFSGAITSGTLSLVSNRAVLMNTVFPAELIPFRSVLVASVGLPVGVCLLCFIDLLSGTLTWVALVAVFAILMQILFVSGITWVLSLVALVFRDLQHMIYYGVTMLMVITPIAYTPDMVPAKLKLLMWFNPASYFVITLQHVIILNEPPPIHILLLMTVISISVFSLGYLLCRRAKSAFYDYA